MSLESPIKIPQEETPSLTPAQMFRATAPGCVLDCWLEDVLKLPIRFISVLQELSAGNHSQEQPFQTREMYFPTDGGMKASYLLGGSQHSCAIIWVIPPS